MAVISVQELQKQTGEILKRVRKERIVYLIIEEGRPIAVLLPVEGEPIEEAAIETGQRPFSSGWAAYASLAEEIRRSWPPHRSAQAALDEVRR
jgi:prevent-host-death family protein